MCAVHNITFSEQKVTPNIHATGLSPCLNFFKMAVSPGSWTTWEGVVNLNITWADLWKILQARLSFLIRSTYDTLPCPRNLKQWFGSEEGCTVCNTPNTSLQHILSGCNIALSQGRYRWRHDQVLRKLAEVLEGRRQGSKGVPPAENHNHISFVMEDGGEETSDQEKQLGRFALTRSGT